MTTRREFLGDAAGAMAGIVFVGCGLMGMAPAPAQARRREVVVNGRRAKVIDVHAHCAVPEAMALMGLKLGAPGSLLPPLLHMATQASERLRAMDEQGIDVEALSINPYWYKADRDVATQIIKIQNEKLAEACAAHAGGFLPSYSGRSDHGCPTRPDLCPGGTHGPIKKNPSEYLKQLYYDTMVFNTEGVRHLAAEVGAGQLLVGTDYAYAWTKTAVDLVLGTPGLSDAERVAMLGGTAAKLLGIKA